MMSFEMEAEAEIYIGATKEDQAKICWAAAKNFIESPHANPALKQLGFTCKQKEIDNSNTMSFLRPLGGDSKTQDGINSHLSIIDEYHAHATDGVKENLESSSVQRRQPITWHITTAGTNIASVCKAYEDTCKEVLDGIKSDDHLWIMIHDLDEGDDWEDESNWYKANPLLGQGLEIDSLRK
jgi:phage terminase large subunit-like protein